MTIPPVGVLSELRVQCGDRGVADLVTEPQERARPCLLGYRCLRSPRITTLSPRRHPRVRGDPCRVVSEGVSSEPAPIVRRRMPWGIGRGGQGWPTARLMRQEADQEGGLTPKAACSTAS